MAHITAGAVALVSFPVPLLTRKGSPLHRRAGKVYSAAMGVVVIAAFFVCAIRLTDDDSRNDDRAAFLAFVGLLGGVNIVVGLRALSDKKRSGKSGDLISLGSLVVLAVAGTFMLVSGVAFGRGLLWVAFGALSFVTALGNLRTLRTAAGPRDWFFLHLSHMCAACIATVTAVLVVNGTSLGVPDEYSLALWIVPGVVGGIGINRWNSSYRQKFARLRAADIPSIHRSEADGISALDR
jgi:uncharacterized membrane protein